MGKEGFVNPYFTGRLCYAVLEGGLLSTDQEYIQAFAKLARHSFVTCEGESGDRSRELEKWLSSD